MSSSGGRVWNQRLTFGKGPRTISLYLNIQPFLSKYQMSLVNDPTPSASNILQRQQRTGDLNFDAMIVIASKISFQGRVWTFQLPQRAEVFNMQKEISHSLRVGTSSLILTR